MNNRLWVDGSLSGGAGIDLVLNRLFLSNVLVSITHEHALEDLLTLLVHLFSDHLFEGLLWNLLIISDLVLLALSVFLVVLSFTFLWLVIIGRGVIIAHMVILGIIILSCFFSIHHLVQGLFDVRAGDLLHLLFLLDFVLLG
jgi:hypothetical protein